MEIGLQLDQNSAKSSILYTIVIAGAITTFLSLFGPNPLLCLPTFVSLYFIVDKLFLSKYLSGFLMAFAYQWAQVSIKALYATFSFKDIHSLTDYPEHIVTSYLLSTAGLIVITWAISVFLKKISFDEDSISENIENVSIKRLLISYFSLGLLTPFFPIALGQLAMQISAFKWGIFYILFLRLYDYPKGKYYIAAIVSFEFVLGFASYFAAFKDIIFYTAIALFSVVKLTPKRIVALLVAASGVIYFGLLWTGVKGEYRTYISQGHKQVMMVSKTDALTKMLELSTDFKLNDDVVKSFIDRISYIDYFSACISHVPTEVPHENGTLTMNAIKHVLVPRALKHNKAIIDESTHLTKYTGRFFSNYSMGVSFSLGYFGDFYVDFGMIGMLIAILFYGFLIGYVFLDIYNHCKNPLIAIAVMQMSFVLLYKFELSLIKLTGNLIVCWILYRLLDKYVFPSFSKWLMNE